MSADGVSNPGTPAPAPAPAAAGLRAALPSVSVIIPAYNAGRFLANTIGSTRRWLDDAALPHELIVVDDGSTDQTAATAAACGPDIRVIRLQPNRGKGAAVRAGMLAAKLDWALFMDADNSTPISMLDRFAAKLRERPDAQVLIASRRMPDSKIVRAQHPIRQALGRTFPQVVRLIALPDFRDTQCGFKLFSRRAAHEIFSRLRIERFAFDVEALMLAQRLGLPTVEVGVDWDNPTDSTVRLSTDTVAMLRDVLLTKWRLKQGAPAPMFTVGHTP